MGTIKNRFDLVRLILASSVFIYHAFALSSVQPFGPNERALALLAELSIQGFFIVSGALVYGSYERSKGLADYAGKRVRRLYPAYAVIILVPALIALGLTLFSGQGFGQILSYVAANLAFLNFLAPNLPGLFEGQRFSEVNGALWTLKIEVMFYLAVPVIAWFLAVLGKYWWLGITGLILMAFAWKGAMISIYESPVLARQLPGQMMYFAAGIVLWKIWPVLRAQSIVVLIIGALALTLSLTISELAALRVLGLTGLIAGAAFLPGPTLNAAAWGDVSYGVYIVHFPIVQALVAFGVFGALGFWGGLVVSAVLVFALSYLLWWWVEKPALRVDSHYRTVSE
ncbi:MAG: acyltransferase [Pseudomonadota bacterium]